MHNVVKNISNPTSNIEYTVFNISPTPPSATPNSDPRFAFVLDNASANLVLGCGAYCSPRHQCDTLSTLVYEFNWYPMTWRAMACAEWHPMTLRATDARPRRAAFPAT